MGDLPGRGRDVAHEGAMQDIEFVDKIAIYVLHDPCILRKRHYAIGGEFGTVSLEAERPVVRLKRP